MSSPSRPGNWKRLALVIILIVLVLVLYPQLKDFGAEIVRAFT